MSDILRKLGTVLVCGAIVVPAPVAAEFGIRYFGNVGAGQLYGGPGNNHSFSSGGWVAETPAVQYPDPLEVESYGYKSQGGSSLRGDASIGGRVDQGVLGAFGIGYANSIPAGGETAVPGAAGAHVYLEWYDILRVPPGAVRDTDGFLRLPWGIDYAGKIEVGGNVNALTGAAFTVSVEALSRPGYNNILGYSLPYFEGLKFTQGYYGKSGVSIYDVKDLPGPDDPYHGVIALPPGLNEVYLHGVLQLEIDVNLPGAGEAEVRAELLRPFQFYLKGAAANIGQVVHADSAANYAAAPVPEPGVAVMMLAGIGLISAFARRPTHVARGA
ncbi:MAG: PEP-CTERM sorting domain-containing protein [Burkholderiales bacterium]|nr:PEP-CTERM sorting domain-containing protein [Burkholderiales bacterium]